MSNTIEKTNIKLDDNIVEVLIEKIVHDLINNISSVSNSAELLQSTITANQDSDLLIQLIGNSSKSAINSLTLYRYAYTQTKTLTYSEPFEGLLKEIDSFLSHHKINFSWNKESENFACNYAILSLTVNTIFAIKKLLLAQDSINLDLKLDQPGNIESLEINIKSKYKFDLDKIIKIIKPNKSEENAHNLDISISNIDLFFLKRNIDFLSLKPNIDTQIMTGSLYTQKFSITKMI